ncbi:uncharacterized protein At3g06530 isoform X2 [Salvia miltiorrhiza]|uniref:uncharacterized protein At3g06530 isoform X2 n=1 Tax=Salvia miltiorrhiza TaxID=226208 RepID=UPI0025AC21AD|nr:uncharacterized protein At3g06530 isoform X2 [Salvia miltiorrhiza]
MAGRSISSQLHAIKTVLNASTDPEPGKKRPLTRPSILFDAKAAADVDLDTIFSVALSGLEVLISMEERFRNYKNDLFSFQSKELDRELVGQEENKRINASLGSYLRLLSGYLELHSALKTLEYLIRRYKIHVYNAEELILCALPYHDTHVFVQIIRLIDAGNSRWKFLDGVKESGARPPREVIVQHCVRDMGILETICNYATPVKKIQTSQHVTGFCTAVIFEVLGLVTVDSDIVKRILPYVSSGLQHGAKGLNQKASALMIVSLLAQKAALAPNVAKSLLHSVADMARTDAKEGRDMRWLRMSVMTIISIVQCMDSIPKKTLDALNEIRDISGILSGLTKDFNIDKFLVVLLESLLEYSASDDVCHHILMSMIKTVPVRTFVSRIVTGLLATHMKSSQGTQNKQILVSICEKYPNESREAFYSFLKDAKIQKKVQPSYDALCKILDEHLDASREIPDPKSFFALEHSEADVRRSAVLGLDVANILGEKVAGSKKFYAIQDALLRRLYDDDLNVVLAVLNLKNSDAILSSPLLTDALQNLLQRCIQILLSSSSSASKNVALLCTQQVIANFKDQEQYVTTFATMIFPLLLVRPKTRRLNLKALELAKELKWPFYENLVLLPGLEKKLDPEQISSINTDNINKLAKTFSSRPDEFMPWLVKCCNSHEISKTLFFLILLQSLRMLNMGIGQFFAFFDSCFPILKNEWEMLESLGISAEQSKKRIVHGDLKGILEGLDTDINNLHAEILACLFLSLSEAFVATAPNGVSLDMKEKWVSILEDLFIFYACHSKGPSDGAFKKHLEYLSMKCKMPLMEIMLKLFVEEGIPGAAQIESLHSFANICSQLDETLARQLLPQFPSVLVPLSSDNQHVRQAAMSCIKKLNVFLSHINRNGNDVASLHFLGDLLCLIIQQETMIVSDKNFLASFFKSLLCSSSESLLVHSAIGKRFDESTRDKILVYLLSHALGLPAYAKLKILSLVKGAGSKLLSVSGARSLLNDLLENRCLYYLGDAKSCNKLSQSEVDILCLLLECCTGANSSHEAQDLGDIILKALWVNDSEDSAIIEPCMTVLRNLTSSLYEDLKTETQELVFRNLLVLFRSVNGVIQNSTRETLLRINIHCSVVVRVLNLIMEPKKFPVTPQHGKKQKKSSKHHVPDSNSGMLDKERTKSLLSALLEVMLIKKNIIKRTSLVGPLFKLLHLIFVNDEWISEATDQDKVLIAAPSSVASETAAYIQQTLLLTLEDISASMANDTQQKDMAHIFDLQLLVSCARSSSDAVTRNHAFSLITTLVKIIPDKVLDQILDILAAVGESTVTQWDRYSQRVFEGLISAIIPCWLSRTTNSDQFLQVFVDVLPQVAEHRRLPIIAHILRTLGEAENLGSLLFLLFHSLISRNKELNFHVHGRSLEHLTFAINKLWEYEFAVILCEQYSCTTWLPSLILALKRIGNNSLNEDTSMHLLVTMHFVANKLRDPEIYYKLELEETSNEIQTMAGDLMEQVVYHLHLVDFKKNHVSVPAFIKSELKEFIRGVLKTLTKGLLPSTYFKVTITLISHVDRDVRKKALGLLCETVKDLGTNTKIDKKDSVSSLRSLWVNLNKTSEESFEKLCLEILSLLDAPDDSSSTSLKLAAVSALEALANRFPSQDKIFSMCFGSVCRGICSDNTILSSHCLRATGALVNALGPRALPELPGVMDSILGRSRDVSSAVAEIQRTHNNATWSSSEYSLFLSILLTLEAVISKLAGFLNPYLGDILKLVVLHPLSFSSTDHKLKLKADVVRKLITEKIPVRLLLPPVLSMYTDAFKSGQSSLLIVFEMLGNLVGSMDRSSVGAYHAKVFDLCLLALDIRHQNPASVQNISSVEQYVINAIVTLTMKLTETMFRPLFVKTIEWSGLNVEGDGDSPGNANSRAISFYSLVNKLAESHRSLFVPYFKYFLDGCVRGLLDAEDTNTGLSQKKKKAKLNIKTKDKDGALSLRMWHLRALILSSLHKCFLYDTGNSKFLGASNFQVLLKPLVSQLVVEPPVDIESHPDVPSIEEVDGLLVACIGQMAVTAGSDLLWKPLNHEVLMQTRSEKMRGRVLGLRIIKYLVENLKEEYLVFLPETIPFLGELLEDVELPVKSLAQDILKEMESMSGESLREYL